jgi:aspartyl-tRNA(Asn)/glutamyl-tRNA(Gln) amidotransferase subunit B
MPVSDFQPVIGLEVHAQLLTRSKLFCSDSTEFGAPPNHNTCPVCLGLPGVLPVLNARVVELAVRTGLALECAIRNRSVWSRKNYFYPDLPKGYQITQYDQPVCERGRLAFDVEGAERVVHVRRIHIEEDAGKSIHDAAEGESLVDLNRAGVPLLEIVSKPDLRSAEEAAHDYRCSPEPDLPPLDVEDGLVEEVRRTLPERPQADLFEACAATYRSSGRGRGKSSASSSVR